MTTSSIASEATTEQLHPAASDATLEAALVAWLRQRESVLIGYSGGVDSAYLACVAIEALPADRVLAVIGRSASYPAEQWQRAREVADRYGVPVLEVVTDEVNDPRYAANPSNRCYFCKTELWEVLVPVARERGFSTIVDGTNADDLHDYRPGARAAREHGVLSPLADLGFTKDAIRRLSRSRGIPTWSQPSSPCLSSRIPYGTHVTRERLELIERAEGALRTAGVTGDMRVRYHGELARVELAPDTLEAWLGRDARDRLAYAVKAAGFDRVAIDLRGFRSGSLNVLGGVVAEPLVRARSATAGDPVGLSESLRHIDVHCEVEPRDRLAVLRFGDRESVDVFLASAARSAAVELARGQGFTHVGVELDFAVDATIRRD